MTKTHQDLLAEANAEITALTPQQVLEVYQQDDVLIVDVREPDELEKKGRIPGSLHAPRGNLEFLACPDSPFHRPELAAGKRLILHCGGGWRSALAAQTLQRMGFSNVSHMQGGFGAWKKAGGPVANAPPNHPSPRVTGLGGIFFKCPDPQSLNAWYRDHLGLDTQEFGLVFLWKESDQPTQTGYTVWSPMKETTDYFSPSQRPFMINYRVDDLPAMLVKLRDLGVVQVGQLEEHPNGLFAWILDPEDNKIELWQPVPADRDPYL